MGCRVGGPKKEEKKEDGFKQVGVLKEEKRRETRREIDLYNDGMEKGNQKHLILSHRL